MCLCYMDKINFYTDNIYKIALSVSDYYYVKPSLAVQRLMKNGGYDNTAILTLFCRNANICKHGCCLTFITSIQEQ